ncbi:hypothetical protein [Ammoniphilus sp. YIM 78166]|uniref:hypothetical protein n=1 Tax=Ammoniphilus sp. YIM 78166 TaxID=1644106 RepID=UPI00106F418C|nr:hypothetical protein [Ammoniphilus sp. YIM 78166]
MISNLDLQIIEEIKKLRVYHRKHADVKVTKACPFPMMGRGRQGAVFQLAEDKCVKVYAREKDCDREYEALFRGQPFPLFPRVFLKGPNYIVMERIQGITLKKFLKKNKLTKDISRSLLHMLNVFKDIQYERIDHHAKHIFIQPEGRLRVIDVARMVGRKTPYSYPYPHKLLKSLGTRNRKIFFSHLKELDPDLYEGWVKFEK